MKLCQLKLFVVFMFALAGGMFLPPALEAAGYLLFTSQYEGNRGTILEMDKDGNLQGREEAQLGGECWDIKTSPNGRMVIVSGGMSNPMMNIFFIDPDGTITPPLGLNNPKADIDYYPLHNPIAFHRSLPLFYVGFRPISLYQYNTTLQQVELTSSTLLFNYDNASPDLGYSPWSNSLVLLRNLPADNGQGTTYTLQTIRLNTDGSFDQIIPPTKLPHSRRNGFAVSPDGHWAAKSSEISPNLFLTRINEDGSSTITQQINFSADEIPYNGSVLSFTPDSRGLLMLCQQGPYALRFYEIDRENAQLIFKSGVDRWSSDNPTGAPIAYYPFYMALTPDGRFVVFSTQSYPNTLNDRLYVVRVHEEDWSLEYLNGKEVDIDHHLSALGFAPLPERNTARDWMMYE